MSDYDLSILNHVLEHITTLQGKMTVFQSSDLDTNFKTKHSNQNPCIVSDEIFLTKQS